MTPTPCRPRSPRRARCPGGPAGDAVGLLALVAGQDVEHVPDPGGPDGAGRWRIARQVATGRVICTVDPDARHAHKTVSRRQDGFKAHVVVEPDTSDHHRLRADGGRRCGLR